MSLEEYATVRRWTSNLAPSTSKVNLYIMNNWLDWMKENSSKFGDFTPDDFIEFQRNSTRSNEYEILDEVQAWVIQGKGRAGYKARKYATIRGFFKRNRTPLLSDPDFRIQSDKERVVGNLTVTEVRDIILNSNLSFQAAFLCIFQGGMDTVSFEYWNINGYESLKDQLRHDPDVIKIALPGRKLARNIMPFYTLIGEDAINALKKHLKTRPQYEWTTVKGKRVYDESKPLTYIFPNAVGKPLNPINLQTYWRNVLKRKGFVEPETSEDASERAAVRYGKNIHELRDVFRSQWQKSGERPAQVVAEFLLGHQVDPFTYNKAFRDVDYVKAEYRKALPMLQVMSSGSPFGRVEGSRIMELERRLQEAKNGQNDRVAELETQIAQLSKALAKVIQKLEENE
jgi:hypothetical protein